MEIQAWGQFMGYVLWLGLHLRVSRIRLSIRQKSRCYRSCQVSPNVLDLFEGRTSTIPISPSWLSNRKIQKTLNIRMLQVTCYSWWNVCDRKEILPGNWFIWWSNDKMGRRKCGPRIQSRCSSNLKCFRLWILPCEHLVENWFFLLGHHYFSDLGEILREIKTTSTNLITIIQAKFSFGGGLFENGWRAFLK